MLTIVLIILLSAIMISLGQVFFKKAVIPIGTPNLRSAQSYWKFIKAVSCAPMIWIGFGTIGLGIVIWLIALAQAELSVAYPIDSLQYLVILIAARIFLGEKLDRMKIIGTFLIIAGICLIATS